MESVYDCEGNSILVQYSKNEDGAILRAYRLLAHLAPMIAQIIDIHSVRTSEMFDSNYPKLAGVF